MKASVRQQYKAAHGSIRVGYPYVYPIGIYPSAEIVNKARNSFPLTSTKLDRTFNRFIQIYIRLKDSDSESDRKKALQARKLAYGHQCLIGRPYEHLR